MTTYPYSQTTMLVNGVSSTTVVSIMSGMQVAFISFTSPAGTLGSIILSPVQPTGVNIEFKSGQQTLQIDIISFSAQFGFNSGQVTTNGRATDQEGKDAMSFYDQIATWS